MHHAFKEQPEEEPIAEPSEAAEGDDQKPKDMSLRAGLSKEDKAPSPPRHFTPEEIEAYLRSRKDKKRSG